MDGPSSTPIEVPNWPFRDKHIVEEGDIRSRNYIAKKQGWRLTPKGSEFINPSLGLWEQNGATGVNTLRGNQIIYRGWGFITGNGTDYAAAVITFPNSGFDDTEYDLSLSLIGTKNGSDPTARNDYTTQFSAATIKEVDTTRTKTAFDLAIFITSGTMASNFRVLYSWIAIGTKVPT